MTREEWLNALIDEARPMFDEAGYPLPKIIRAAVCPPRGKSKAIGVCWSSTCSTDGGREIWVDAGLNDALRIADTLVHELCHAALPDEVGHKGPFVKLARAMHLEGKPTETTGGEAFKEVWGPIIERVGPYPGAGFQGTSNSDGPKTRKGGPSKVTCTSCDGWFTTAPKKADAVIFCPFCGDPDNIEIKHRG